MENLIYTEVVPPSPSNWDVFGEQIYLIEKSIFGDKAFDKEMMRIDLTNPKTVFAVLKNRDSIIGFTYTTEESAEVANITDTVIIEEYQNKGLVSILMICLETELNRLGYKYVTREAMVENGYADKISKNYTSRIIETREFTGEYGKQRYFKIEL